MKVRWREHEMIFVTIAAVIAISGFWWKIIHLSPVQLQTIYAAPFTANHLAFHLYRNLIFPQEAIFVMVYLAFLCVNLLILPRFFAPRKVQKGTFIVSVSLAKIQLSELIRKLLKRVSWVILHVFALIFLMGIGLNTTAYYFNESLFHYPGFSIFPAFGDHPQPSLDLFGGFEMAAGLLAGYAVYLIFREAIISLVQRPGSRRPYRVMIMNQVTAYLVVYFSIPYFLASFDFADNGFFQYYYFMVTPLIVSYMLMTYVIFPLKGTQSLFRSRLPIYLPALTFICSYIFFRLDENITHFLLYWAAQLFIVTPLTWLLYQRRKDELQLFRGTQKALVKSKTDLQFLRSQINPHFLFNILNTLYGMALQENAERTAGGIQQLGDMMRFMLHENNLDFIQMSREIEYIRHYIALQKLRTRSSPEIIIEDNISDRHCDHNIAPMLLIPFVENAFKHGISLAEKSWIKIQLNCDEKYIRFEVRNSVHARHENDPEKERSGIGLKNVLERLKLLYGGKFQFSVNGDNREFFVQLTIEA